VGLLVWLALWLVYREARDRYARLALLAISTLGRWLCGRRIFPLRPGRPLFGTWRTQIHNIVGFIDYAGTGIGFLLIGRHFARRATFQAVAFSVAGLLVLLCVATTFG
jgi:hypothetical protein